MVTIFICIFKNENSSIESQTEDCQHSITKSFNENIEDVNHDQVHIYLKKYY